MISLRKLAFLPGWERCASAPTSILKGFPISSARRAAIPRPCRRQIARRARSRARMSAFRRIRRGWRRSSRRCCPRRRLALALAQRARRLPQDYPTGRSLHDRPVSRVGGIAIWAGFLPVVLLSRREPRGATPPGLSPWARGDGRIVRGRLVGRASLRCASPSTRSRRWRLPSRCHGDRGGGRRFAAACSSPLPARRSRSSGRPISSTSWMATTDSRRVMSICGFGAFGVAAARAGMNADPFFALASATLVVSSSSTCRRRARSWAMAARSGSGFSRRPSASSAFARKSGRAWFPLLVFLPFVADATVTVLRRLARGDHLFEAHRTHYYQRLHQMGSGHRGTLLFYGILIVGTSASALYTLAVAPGAGWPVLGSVDRRDRRALRRH